MIRQGAFQHLGFRAFWMFVLQKSRFIFAPVAFYIALAILSQYVEIPADLLEIMDEVLIGLLIAFVVLLFGSLVVSGFQYAAYEFMLDEHALKMRSGILNIQIEAIPYRQMQNVDIERNILFRALGVSRIVILTAGTEDTKTGNESQGIIPVLDKHLAMQVQEELLRRSNIEKTMMVAGQQSTTSQQ